MVIFAWERNTEAERGKMVLREKASRVKKTEWNDFHTNEMPDYGFLMCVQSTANTVRSW